MLASVVMAVSAPTLSAVLLVGCCGAAPGCRTARASAVWPRATGGSTGESPCWATGVRGFAVLPRSGFSASVSFKADFLLDAAGIGHDVCAPGWDLLGVARLVAGLRGHVLTI
jgi:hypothetical protein